MSWQTYVDTNLVGTGKVSRAAIVGLAGGVWASSPGYTLTTEEQNALIATMKDPATAQAQGVRLAQQKFFFLREDGRTLQVKKQADGAVIVKTKQAILVAEYIHPIQAAETTTIVERLADYLIGVGY